MSDEETIESAEGIEAMPIVNEPNMSNFDINSLPEKFRNAEDPMKAMIESYGALESKIGSVETKVETASEEGELPSKLEITKQEVVVDDNILETFSERYSTNDGSFTDRDYNELAKKGYNRQMVDTYIAGQEAVASKNTASILKHFGDDLGQFEEASSWAAENLSDAEIKSINEQFKNPSLSGIAAQTLNSMYRNATEGTGDPQVRLEGSTSNVYVSDVFENTWELQQAQRHPEYGKDGTYDKNLNAKVARSIRAGKI